MDKAALPISGDVEDVSKSKYVLESLFLNVLISYTYVWEAFK